MEKILREAAHCQFACDPVDRDSDPAFTQQHEITAKHSLCFSKF